MDDIIHIQIKKIICYYSVFYFYIIFIVYVYILYLQNAIYNNYLFKEYLNCILNSIKIFIIAV